MKFNRVLLASKKIIPKLVISGFLLGILWLLCLRSRFIRSIVIVVVTILIAGIGGGTIGAIAGIVLLIVLGICASALIRLRKSIARVISPWLFKQDEQTSLYRLPFSTLSRSPTVRSQLRIATDRSPTERLLLIAELETSIRVRTPDFSAQDLQDLSLLSRERQQIIDEESWSPARRARVNRIAEIRRTRQANGQMVPSGLVDHQEEIEEFVTSSDLHYYEPSDYDDDPYGIGDLSCQYNARSLFLRCAVNPGVDTCEGCRDYRSRDGEEIRD